ncbi:MAG: hypothetical protein HFF13_10260 [Angelakisella sp.]|jgi:phage minor structural protein|nr:hypothetical protein [Angelakisella sp.]
MKPVLYPSQETAFGSNGLGILTDAASCVIIEERNGAFELEMTYPVSGIHYKEIAPRCIILAKPNPVDDPQPFRVYRITKPMGGLVTVYGEHISYDLAGVPASPFAAESAPDAMEKLKSSSAIPTPFSFWTDKDTAGTMGITAPVALRSLLGGREGSVLDVYGGEYKFDRYTVRLYNQRGQNRGASIRYGKNLTDLTQDENIAGVYTGVYPYWSSMEGALVQLPEKILPAPGNYDFTRIMTLDLSSEFQEPPTQDQLRARAEAYMKANNIGVPRVSLTVSFVPLEQTEEYKDIGLLERVELCDTVNVEFPALGVSATAKCVRTVYDALLDRYKSVELGDARTNIADTIAAQQQKIEQAPDKTFVQQAVDSATGQITGNKGGYVVLHSSTGSKEPDEILIMDTPDIKTAVKVWRWNKAGLGYSSYGYNGPYGLAMTQDGSIVADFITAGTLDAALAKVINLDASNINTGSLNASLIKTGVLDAALAKIINIDASSINTGSLNAERIKSGRIVSVNGITEMDLDDGKIYIKQKVGNGVLILSESGLELKEGGTTKVSINLNSGQGGKITSDVRTDNLNLDYLKSDFVMVNNLQVREWFRVNGEFEANSIETSTINTETLRVDGLDFSPETITDRNGERWTVLAIAAN